MAPTLSRITFELLSVLRTARVFTPPSVLLTHLAEAEIAFLDPSPSVLAGRHANFSKKCTMETRLRGELASVGTRTKAPLSRF
jgi:hypothetical protein